MTGLFEDEPTPKQEQVDTPVLAYLEKFFRLERLKYDQLEVHIVGDEDGKIVSSVEVLGLPKSMFGLVPASMASDVGMTEEELIHHFIEQGALVMYKSAIMNGLPLNYFDPSPAPKLLIRRR